MTVREEARCLPLSFLPARILLDEEIVPVDWPMSLDELVRGAAISLGDSRFPGLDQLFTKFVALRSYVV